MPPSRALVTGATGLVGVHLVDRLLKSGWTVRALVRQPAVATELAASGVECVRGDILDGDAFARSALGCDVIFHTAAVVTSRGDWESFRRPNVDGTHNAVTAAERSGARLLHLSSVAVYDARYARRSTKIREDTPLLPLDEHAFYARSKRESEALVFDAQASGRIWATAVRPVVIYGTHDRQFVPRIARILRFGVAPLIGGGRTTLPIVHAANVADGALLAATTDSANGQVYNLTNDFDVTVREFFTLAAAGLGRRVRLVPIPTPVARAGLRVAIALVRLARSGAATVVSPDSVDMLTNDNPFASERARRELGWSPTVRPESGVPEAFRWSIDHRNAGG